MYIEVWKAMERAAAAEAGNEWLMAGQIWRFFKYRQKQEKCRTWLFDHDLGFFVSNVDDNPLYIM